MISSLRIMLWCLVVHAAITIALVADTGDGDSVTLCDHRIVTGSVAEPMHDQATCRSACIPPVLRGFCTRWVHCSGENFSKLWFRGVILIASSTIVLACSDGTMMLDFARSVGHRSEIIDFPTVYLFCTLHTLEYITFM